MLERQKKIHEFSGSLNYEIKSDYLRFSYSKELNDYLQNTNIDFESIRTEEIHISFSDLGFEVFENATDFLIENSMNKERDILILNYEDRPLSRVENQAYINFTLKEDFYFFKNPENYVNFINFLKSRDQETEDAFHFIDYSNDVNRKIVLTSITEKSRIILRYFKEIPNLPNNKDYSVSLDQFKNCFEQENNNLPKFLKSVLIKYASRYEPDERLKLVFQNLRSIVDEAKINFEIYINNLSIDKIRKDYDEYKSKYFSEVSDILKKISQQVIGFPIVIASTLFAVEKVKANSTSLYFIAVVILVTTIYLILLLKMNFRDLKYVKQLSDKDYNSIKGNNFFIRFPNEFQIFQQIKSRIDNRIQNLIIVCESYFWILGLSNTALIGIILSYLNVPKGGILLISIAIITVMVFARNTIWNEKKEE
ncbi:hypothetical protein U6A24_22410 [Aquimarina gracilis]|uniref:Uncharacterized protein n=1 Tax=Aquimarina gracilis TaxID=874422 RepID=A0ABU6A258_9FLAO|nr:hypothetical protein [Aquimarina gracilis]MEB3348248.1 hypothetical protein [Aquimarina gracilis]